MAAGTLLGKLKCHTACPTTARFAR